MQCRATFGLYLGIALRHRCGRGGDFAAWGWFGCLVLAWPAICVFGGVFVVGCACFLFFFKLVLGEFARALTPIGALNRKTKPPNAKR